jgi:formate dehydrogenase beta subunit
MSNGNLEVKAISGHRGGTAGGGEYNRPDGSTRSGATRDYDVCKLVDTTTCIGCKACEVACVEWNGYEFRETTFADTYQTMPETEWNFWNLIKFNEVENDNGLQWLMRKDQCMHCEEPGCLIACPADGAIVQYTNGIVDFNQANCIGCQYCVSGCPFNIPKFNAETKKVYKCTLCSDRVGAGLEPACIKSCPTGCLHFGSKEDMKFEAIKRVNQLKANGHPNAGIYNPGDPDPDPSATSPGSIGGTHVIYVLHDKNKPEQYSLPSDPSVPFFVKMWKGPLKWLGGIGMGLGLAALFGHYVRYGPKPLHENEEGRDKAQ